MDETAAVALAVTVISSFTDSDSDEESPLFMCMHEQKKNPRTCIKDYLTVVSSYSLNDFSSHFRVTRGTFEKLTEIIAPLNNTNLIRSGRPSHCITKQLLVVLWFMGNQETYRSVCDRFDLAKSTGWEYVHNIAQILTNVSNQYIKWPNADEAQRIINNFKVRHNFVQVIGVIDGTHIPITAPNIMPQSYVNRNKYHSLILQGVCDSKFRFTDCFAGVPGSVHDARVFRMSPLGKAVDRRSVDLFPFKSHLLGDSAYPCKTFLLTPYKDTGRLSRIQKQYNFKHAGTRVYIEQAFGILKGRFRILKNMNVYRTDLIPNIIIACCVLHNICINFNDIFEVEEDYNYYAPLLEERLFGDDIDGAIKRNEIASRL